MIPKHDGKKLSANEYAKRLVAQYGEGAKRWYETITEGELDAMTDSQTEDVNRFVEKHYARVLKLLGLTE